MSFIVMSLTGTVMIMVIAIIRVFFKYKMPKRAFVVLWCLVILRLLLPIEISMLPSFFLAERYIQGTTEAVVTFETIDNNVMANTSNIYTWHYAQTAIDQQYFLEEEAASALPALPLLIIIWLVGVACSGMFFIILYIRHRRKFLTSLPLENEFIANWQQMYKLKRRQIRVRISDRITTPLTYGVFYPVILLPKKINLSDKERLSHILVHEFIHIQRFDVLKKLLMTAVVCVHWFNPFVWAMHILFSRDLEISCDEGAIKLLGESAKSQYAMTLIDAQEQSSYLSLHNAFSKYAIEERVYAIMGERKVSFAWVFAALLLVVGIPVMLSVSTTDEVGYYTPARPVRIVDISIDNPGDDVISAQEAAAIGIEAFPRYFPDFVRDWGDTTFIMHFGATLDPVYNRSGYRIGVAPLWQGMVTVDIDGGLGHDFPFVFAVHAKTGEVLTMYYAPRTNYALAVEEARLEGEGAVAAVFAQWSETYHKGERAGRHNVAFREKARQIADEIKFFDSQVVSVELYRIGVVPSGPVGVVRLEYESGDAVQLEILMLEGQLVGVKYIRQCCPYGY